MNECEFASKIERDGVIVRGHLHISSYFRDLSIRPVLIGQKSLLNQEHQLYGMQSSHMAGLKSRMQETKETS